MSSVHVDVHHGKRHEEIHVKGVHHIIQHPEDNNQTGILKVGELNVHSPELYSPSNLRIHAWGRLESH